jgi:hypothetical protein
MRQDLTDDLVRGTVIHDTESIMRHLQRGELTVQQVGIHILMLARCQPLRNQLLRAIEKNEGHSSVRKSALQCSSIACLQGGAGKHARRAGRKPSPQQPVQLLQPGLPIGIIQRMTRRHLLLVRQRMIVVGVSEFGTGALGQQLTDRRLARSGHAHYNNNHAASHFRSSSTAAAALLRALPHATVSALFVALWPEKHRLDVPLEEIGGYVARYNFFIRLKRRQVTISHLSRYFEAYM